MRRTGNVTIAVIAAIAVLFILVGTTVASFTRMKSELSKRYLDQLRARVLAQNGLDFAMDRLRSISVQDLILDRERTWQYYGEDLDANGQLDKNEDQNNNGYLNTNDCPLKEALRPSFTSYRIIQHTPVRGGSPHKSIGYSARQGGTYPGGQDIFSLKVIDGNSRIYLNATDAGTRRLLNNLGAILGIEKVLTKNGDKKLLGDAIYEARLKQTKGFAVKEELLQFLPSDTYELIKDYVTIYARVDRKVLKPKPISARSLHIGQDIFGWSELNPGNCDLESRAPVNINTAGKTVLLAVLANLEGIYLQEALAEPVEPQLIDGGAETPASAPGKIRIGRLNSVALRWSENRRLVEQVVDRIIKARTIKPFLEWADFNRFCDELISNGILGKTDTADAREVAQTRADLIKANANPNTIFNKFNPDRLISRKIDKSDLTAYTTEFCLTPGGYFEIESLGMVFRPIRHEVSPPARGNVPNDNKQILESEYLLRSVVELFNIYSETTQQDFDRGIISKTKGPAITADAWTLATYPEPLAIASPCATDGFIGLNSVENSRAKDERVTFQNHFRHLRADYAKGDPDAVKTNGLPIERSVFSSSQSTPAGSIYPDGVYSEWSNCPAYDAPNNLVDGPAHERLYGTKRFRGTISLWLKPNYSAASAKPRIIFSATKAQNKEPHPDYRYQTCQNVFELFAFPLGMDSLPTWNNRINISPVGKLVWFWEIDESLGNQPDEYIFAQPMAKDDPHHRWLHIGIAWDTHPGKARRELLSCNRCDGTGKIEWCALGDMGSRVYGPCRDCAGTGEIVRYYSPRDVYTFCINGNDLSDYIYNQPDIFPPDIVQPISFSDDNLIRFGEKLDMPFWNSSGDFTIDEVIIRLDDSTNTARMKILEEYKKGRYYRGNGSFISGDINIAGNTINAPYQKLRMINKYKVMANWTVYYPHGWDNTRRPVSVEFLNDDNTPIAPRMTNPQGTEFETAQTSMRYRVRFQGDLNDLNTPLIETPLFDDINVMVFKPVPVVLEQYVMP